MRGILKRISLCIIGAAVLAALSTGALGQYRAADGSGNNAAHPDWGSTGSIFLRTASGAHYADGVGGMITTRPDPRTISNTIFSQPSPIYNTRYFSDFVWQFGQFIDHDFALTDQNALDPADIPVPPGDPYFDPAATGAKTIAFDRSVVEPLTGATTPREHANLLTAWIDGSQVYGSDASRAAWLREDVAQNGQSWKGAKLKTTPSATGDLLPFNDGTQVNAAPEGLSTRTDFMVAGDIRANEQTGLTAMHTLFVREHNRLVEQIAASAADLPADPAARDEEIYQRARRLVGAEIQKIAYEDWLPLVLGPDALDPYTDYAPDTNPNLSTLFSTAAYRIGHTMLSPQLQRLANDGTPIPEGPLALRDAFFTPTRITDEGGIEPLLKGLASQPMQHIDAKVIDDVRSFLFGAPGSGGFDLVSLNLQRGRDHGLPDYNTARADMGLLPKDRFLTDGMLADGVTPNGITDDAALAASLEGLFGDVDNVDLFVGGLAEDTLGGSALSELLTALWADQFTRLRDGDAFYYDRPGYLTLDELTFVQNTTLADIIRANTAITNIQDNAFTIPEPCTLALVAAGCCTLLGALRRRLRVRVMRAAAA